MFTDTHCHIVNEFFDNKEEVLKKAINNNIHRVISCGDSIKSSKEVYEDTYKYDNYYCAIGIHPENQDESFKEFERLFYYCLPNKNVVAIGEIGLDFHYEDNDPIKQIDLFRKQLELALKEDFPVIIHSRQATQQTLDIIKEYPGLRGVIHCFSGSLEIAREYVKLGFYIGVGGVATFKNANIKEVIKELPLENILLETDSPFLAPEPHRGKTNEPAYIMDIAKFIADLFNISLEELSAITENNVNKLFFN